MNVYKNLLIFSIIMLFFAFPVSADTQRANGTVVGDGNQQTIVNDYYNKENADNTNQEIDVSLTDSAGNTIITLNDNSDGKTEIDTVNSDSSSTTSSTAIYNFLPDPKSVHYTLDTGSISSEVTSIYMGEVIVIQNDENNLTLQKEGEHYQYTIKSSVPLLAYIIKSSDSDKIRSTSGAPVFNEVEQKYSHGGVQVALDRKRMSTFQQFTFDVEENGKYALVMDTRVTQHRNGLLSQITDDTVDIYYSIDKITINSTITNNTQPIFTNVSVFPVNENGKANTS